MTITCTKRLEFDYAHRLPNHEGKCKHLHGHRGVVEITCAAAVLDHVGRIVDFGDIKRIVGGWLDEHLDHACIVHGTDDALLNFLEQNDQRHFVMPVAPTAENLAILISHRAQALLETDVGLDVARVRFYETPNGWADWLAP